MNVCTRSLLHRVILGSNGITQVTQQLIPESASLILTVDFCSSSVFHADRPPSANERRNLKHHYQKHRQDFLLSKERIKVNLRTQRDETVRKVKEMATENIFTVPNLLCVIRIGLTPYIGHLILQENFRLACGVAFFAGLTDLADGYIARKFPSQRSNAGSFLDPLADKLLVTTVVITLTMVHLIPVPLTALIVARDICLIAAAFVVRYKSIPPPITLSKYFDLTYATANLSPTTISKYNTGIQLFLAVTTLGAPVLGYVDHPALHALWYITAASTIASAGSYMFQKGTYQYFLRKKPGQDS